MNTIGNKEITLENQIRERVTLGGNATGFSQDNELFMVQFDDDHAVGSDGCIYQIVSKNDIVDEFLLFYYADEGDNYYNYAEDTNKLEGEDLEIFEHCLEQAELCL